MTMNKELFEQMQQLYSPIISRIIDCNIKFYRTNRMIQWQFVCYDSLTIFASCSIKTNVLSININAVRHSFLIGEPYQIEYFLLHEIRHIYQHLAVADYKLAPSKCNNARLAEKWAYEEENYIAAKDDAPDNNRGYYTQDIEMDAFAYSYAVMKYKYGEIPYLYLPQVYDTEEFKSIVNDWIDTFKSEGL